MKIEEIILFIFQILLVILEAYVACLALKYLKKKPLGMQTILDKVAKDTIMCVLFHQVLKVFVTYLMCEFAGQFGDDVALIISILIIFFNNMRLWQFISVIIVRYMLVFYHTYLNKFDEKVTRRIIRSFVCISSAIIALLLKSKNTFPFKILTGGSLGLDFFAKKSSIPVIFIIIIISLIVTQYQIEKFKKSVDGQSFDNLESIQEGDDRCRNQMNFNVYRIELITAAITFLTKALSILLLWFFPLDDYFYLKILGETLTLLDQVLTLVFSLMFIFKNEKVCSFFKHRSRNLLLCQSPSDFYIQSANSNIYAIYNPKLYEAHEDCLNFEETISQHNHNELGSHDDSNVYEFSSVIFVDEKRKKEKDSANLQHIDKVSVSSNDEENYRNHYEPMPGCSHWSDDDPDHNHEKKKKYIAPKPKIQSLPSVSI